MGNIVKITDQDGNHIADGDFGMGCFIYFNRLAAKYNPAFDSFVDTDRINKELEVVYEKATPEDKVVILTFINTKNTFTEEHIPHFRKAIEDYPTDYLEGPKRVLTKVLKILEEHREINTEYVNTYVALSVHKTNETATVH